MGNSRNETKRTGATMGLLKGSSSLTRYKVEGTIEGDIIETVRKALSRHVVRDIDGDPEEKSVGWTSFDAPFAPNFDGSKFLIGNLFVFGLRIDKKSIPSKLVQKKVEALSSKRLQESGRPFLTRDEKSMIREQVLHALSVKIPATPNTYDVVWNHEKEIVHFFSTLTSANEELETLFKTSFRKSLIRLFPFTCAELTAELSDTKKDRLHRLSPKPLME
jgi:DNA recombination-dependent growth factor C